MIEIISFVIRIERTEEWLLVIYLAQRESVFVIFQVLAFYGCVATSAAT